MENLNLKKRLFKFRDQYAKDIHFDKHKHEEFPTKPVTSNHYEDIANQDIKEAGFLTVSYTKNYSSSKYNFGLLTFHTSTPTTLNVVSFSENNLLHSYYVPKCTFIPEFLIFSYFFDKYRKKIFLSKTENESNKVSLIFDLKDKFPAGTFLRWTEDFFFMYKTITNNTKSKKEFLKFFINSRKGTIHFIDEYVELNKIILSIIDIFIKNGLILNSVKIEPNNFAEIEKLIIYTDEQLHNFLMFEPENQLFSITQVFTLAYMFWIYSMVYKDQPKSLYLKSINNSIGIKFYFDLYSELFKELNQATSLEEIFN